MDIQVYLICCNKYPCRYITMNWHCSCQKWNLAGILATQAFLHPPFLAFKECTSASMTFPEFKKQVQMFANLGRGGIRDQGGTVKTIVQHWGRILVPLQGIERIAFSSSSELLRPPPRWSMATSGWARDSWSTASLPHHQPIRSSAPLTANFSYKNFFPQIIEELGLS